MLDMMQDNLDVEYESDLSNGVNGRRNHQPLRNLDGFV